jgi:hypothetical protein
MSWLTDLLGGNGVPNPEFVLPNLCKQFDDAPLTPLSAPDPNDPAFPKVVFEQPGEIKVMHGFGTAELPDGKNILKVEQSVAVPDYATRATVFLNGWRLNYRGDDQHILMVGSAITKITLDLKGRRLTWNAAGVLRDDDFKEGYSFTYQFTVIAWNNSVIDLVVDHGRADDVCNTDTDLPDKSFLAISNGTTALSAFSVFARLDPTSLQRAVLPRGFGFAWWGGDHHLLQLGYNLDHSEIFVEQGEVYNNPKPHVRTVGDIQTLTSAPLPIGHALASRVDDGFVSWKTYAVLKDNDDSRYYAFGELVSVAGGNDVGVVQPPFAILPKEGEGGGSTTGGVMTQEFQIEQVPFVFAVPMLTGWELAYVTDDQHVKEVGIWIDDWFYVQGLGGTLHYTLSSILRDNDSSPAHYSRHKITVLGIRSLVGQTK